MGIYANFFYEKIHSVGFYQCPNQYILQIQDGQSQKLRVGFSPVCPRNTDKL